MNKKELRLRIEKDWLKKDLVDLIIMKNLNINKKELFFLEEIDNSFLEWINKDLQRLKSWEAIEYIIWKANFFWEDFIVDNRVLIPRNDTEVMVSESLKTKNIDKYFIVDIWTWSGAIICSILKNSEIKKWFAIDISKDALELAKKNILKHNLEEKIEILEWDLSSPIAVLFWENKINWKKIIITANLPYVKNWDFENMSIETLKFEPNLALFWWKKTWFELYEKLIFQCLELKRNFNLEEILLFIEIWFDQKDYSSNFLKNLELKFEIFKDNFWIDRCIKIWI